MKVHIIAVEGLDGAGKTTFVPKLYNAIISAIKPGVPRRRLNIVMEKFPQYESEMGKYIKGLLDKDSLDHSEKLKLAKAFQHDRNLWFIKNYPIFDEYKEVVVVCDRYALSLPITMAPMFDDVKKQAELFWKEEKERFRNVMPEMNIVLKMPFSAHVKRLSDRKDKDGFEKDIGIIDRRCSYLDRVLKWVNPDGLLVLPAAAMDPKYTSFSTDMEKLIIDKCLAQVERLINTEEETVIKRRTRFDDPSLESLFNKMLEGDPNAK